jgi:DNA repair protein RadC
MKKKTYSETIPVMLFASEKLEGTTLTCAVDAKDYCSDLSAQDREMMVVVAMNPKGRVIKRFVHTIGDVDSFSVHPRIIFRDLLSLAAASFILIHNHPSGDVQPSLTDKKLTEDMSVAGKLLGFNLLDHIIVAHGGIYYSFSDEGVLADLEPRLTDAHRFGQSRVRHG